MHTKPGDGSLMSPVAFRDDFCGFRAGTSVYFAVEQEIFFVCSASLIAPPLQWAHQRYGTACTLNPGMVPLFSPLAFRAGFVVFGRQPVFVSLASKKFWFFVRVLLLVPPALQAHQRYGNLSTVSSGLSSLSPLPLIRENAKINRPL